MVDRRPVAEAVAWAAAVTVAERLARQHGSSRSRAILAVYVPLGLAAGITRLGPSQVRRERAAGGTLVGFGLAFGGYQMGRWLLGDRPTAEPPDPLPRELAALGIVVPLAEEALWGSRVEPAIGIGATAAAFALKHPVVDGRWRRALGLGAFWVGLGLLRRRSRRLALAAHVAANTGAVVLGHLTRRDRF